MLEPPRQLVHNLSSSPLRAIVKCSVIAVFVHALDIFSMQFLLKLSDSVLHQEDYPGARFTDLRITKKSSSDAIHVHIAG